MSIIEVKLGILDEEGTKRELAQAIQDFYENQLFRLIERQKPILLELIRGQVEINIKNSPEYFALMPGGPLYGQIGNPNIQADVDHIINFIKQNVNLEMVFTIERGTESPDINGNVEIALLPDYAILVNESAGKFTTEKGQVLSWLEWLLLEGTHNIVLGYYYVENSLRRTSISSFSRTGTGIMRKRGGSPGKSYNSSAFYQRNKKAFGDKSWSVPPEFSGTAQDNWFTRAFKGIDSEIQGLLESEFNRLGI